MLWPKTHVEKQRQPLEPHPRVGSRANLFLLDSQPLTLFLPSQLTSSQHTRAEREEVFPVLRSLLINLFKKLTEKKKKPNIINNKTKQKLTIVKTKS